ncbi:EAL domain-containing protein [Noviherbaspirillum sp.]|uniref:EAL domain-containing protein n=1 Tax=Noviherbaspirillum sp. TaxID=1926288 RepID=UPI0025F52A01|nr:EAL domain-containing protein [Noviherbaspirillum sp.]
MLAHSMNLRVIAEGAETEDQLAFLCTHHCDQIQGYYFSPPVPAAQLEDLLRANQALRGMVEAMPAVKSATIR